MSGIVVGIDGSHHATRALAWAMAEAAVRGTDLTVIAVSPSPRSIWTGHAAAMPGDEARVEEVRKAAEQDVSRAASELGDQQPKSVTVTAVNGFPAQTLIDASENSDLLVVGSRGAGGFGSLVLGSVSTQVVHHAKCPVVVVRAAA